MKVGDTIYRFDSSYRVYSKDGIGGYGPVYSEHWRPTKITDETARSWVTAYGKVPKRGHDARLWAMTTEQVMDDIFVRENAVRACTQAQNKLWAAGYEGADILRKIIELTGYKQ